jgi:iron complex outermembrane receptor protein
MRRSDLLLFTVRSFGVAIALCVATPAFPEEAAETATEVETEVAADEADAAEEAEEAEEAQYQRTAEPGAEEEIDDLESIVTTGRRRRELLQETPVSASVLSGSLLEERGIDTLDEVGVYIPNLSSFAGVQHQGSFYARGVGQRDAVVTLDPGVGIYVDDVYVARGHGALLSTLDLERVEMLRGPQGTLYGKNTIGGALKLVSEKPGPTPLVGASFGGGSFGAFNSTSMLNAPIVDDLLYSRFNFATRSDQGYTRNEFNDQSYNNDDLLGTRGQLRMLPHEYLTLDVSGHWSKQVMDARGSKCRIGNQANAAAIGFVVPQFPAACQAADDSSTFDFSTNRDDKYRLQSYGTALTADWELGSALDMGSFDVKSISSWQQQDVDDGFLDLDATELPLVEMWTVETQRQRQLSQEFQASSDFFDDRVKLTSGVYGFWENTDDGDIASTSFGSNRLERVEIQNTSYAVYSQSSYTPFDWMELTGGVRWTHETKSAHRSIGLGADPGQDADEMASRDFSKWTPMAGVAFRAPESMLDGTPVQSGILYFTYAQGYKSGGFSTRRDPSQLPIAEFDPEELDNFEVGVKLDLFQNRVQLNSAFFYSLYEDIQLTVGRVNPASPPFQPDIGSSIANAGKAHITGFEIEGTALLFDSLRVRSSLGLTDAEYDKFVDRTWDIDPGTGLVTNVRNLDRSGEDFFNVPALSVDGSIEYAFDIRSFGLPNAGTLTPLLHVYWQDSTDTHFTATGYESGEFRQDSYTLLDLRLIYDLWDDRTQMSFFVNNLLDTEYFTSSVDLSNTLGIGGVYFAAPRTIGGEIRYRWNSPSWLSF